MEFTRITKTAVADTVQITPADMAFDSTLVYAVDVLVSGTTWYGDTETRAYSDHFGGRGHWSRAASLGDAVRKIGHPDFSAARPVHIACSWKEGDKEYDLMWWEGDGEYEDEG